MNRGVKALVYILLIVLVVFSLAPFFWELSTSFKPRHEVMQLPQTILPSDITFENYTGIFERRPFGRYVLNSLLVDLVLSTDFSSE